jgi:hypothetical protein
MRLWSIHPKYLDRQGLLALWREALLAQAVLRGETKGYRNHPQLVRFQAQPSPLDSIASFLSAVHSEATARGYVFDAGKISSNQRSESIPVGSGQIDYEWHHLLSKLSIRAPELHQKWQPIPSPECHPLFIVHPGPMEPWERTSAKT